jgi:hypothetical protein
MRLRAVSITDRTVYMVQVIDPAHPQRPVLEVDARTLPGDLEGGPLLVSVAEFSVLVGPTARECIAALGRRGRVVSVDGVRYLTFPTWEPIGTT